MAVHSRLAAGCPTQSQPSYRSYISSNQSGRETLQSLPLPLQHQAAPAAALPSRVQPPPSRIPLHCRNPDDGFYLVDDGYVIRRFD